MRTFKSEFTRLGLLQTRRREITMKSKASDKPKERLTDRDWAEIMGVNRQTYKRVNGAVRRR